MKNQNFVIWIKKLLWFFNLYILTHDIYKDIAEDVDTRFDTSNYELDRPLD